MLRRSDRSKKVNFGISILRPSPQRKFAFEAVQLGLLAEFVAPLGDGETLIEHLSGVVRSAGLNVGVAEYAEVVGKREARAGCPIRFEALHEQR